MELGRFWTDACHSGMCYVGFGGCLAGWLVEFGLRQARAVYVRVASDHGDVQVVEALLGRRGSSPRICPVVLISSTVEMTDGAGAPYDSHTNGEKVSPMAVTSASYFLRLTSSRCRAACKGFDWALERQ